MSRIGFKTRKHGTRKQIGKKFPVLKARALPKIRYPRVGGKFEQFSDPKEAAYWEGVSRLKEQAASGDPETRAAALTGLQNIGIGGGKNTGIQMEPLLSPWTGAPLEPAPEYGSSIMYDPYSQSFVMVSVPEARIEAARSGGKAEYLVKPRFTMVDEESLKIAKRFLTDAVRQVEQKQDLNAFERAYQRLHAAASREPWLDYPTAGLQKHPVYTTLKEADSVVHSYLAGAKEALIETDKPDAAEGGRLVSEGINRLRGYHEAIVGPIN